MPMPRSISPAPARGLREAAVVVLTYAAATVAVAFALPGLLDPLPVPSVTAKAQPVVARTVVPETAP